MTTTGKSLQRLLALTIAIVLCLTAGCFSASAEEAPLSQDVSVQIDLIYSKLVDLVQADGEIPWYYSVMDLDRNGKLEFFAATQHPSNRSTNLKVWEVNANDTGLSECVIEKDPEESFPDIITDAADTFHDYETDTWYGLYYDNIVLSPTDLYTIQCAVSLKNGIISYTSYGVEHTELINTYRYVSHMNNDGFSISTDQYNDLAIDAFAGKERSATNFDWFTAAEATSASRLADSYEVFAGSKAAPEKSPIIALPIMQHDELAPVAGPAGDPNAIYMIITKNPTSERKKVGQSLKFVADANIYDSCYWTFVMPDGGEVDLEYFQTHFVVSSVYGAYGPVLSIDNLDPYVDGWGAYCTFYFKGQTAVTSTAWINLVG